MSKLMNHAEREMRLAGLFDADADYNGMLANAVMELMKVFADQGHSGASAGMTIQLFSKLARFENLTPLTDDPAEWNEFAAGEFQSRRKSSVFSRDGLKTAYDIDALPGESRAVELVHKAREAN